MDNWLSYWPVIGTAINVLVLWIAWSIRRLAEERIRAAVGEVNTRISSASDRVTRMEMRMEMIPSHHDMQVLHARVSEVKDKVYKMAADSAGTQEAVQGLKKSMDLLVKHHMRGSQ